MYKVAIQGIKGSFHQEAAERFFQGEDVSYLECMSFPEVVRSSRGSDSDFGVIAIENALIGTILSNYKLIQNNHLRVIGEVYLPISLNLMALPGQSKKQLKEVWSHPLAIMQSENYLDQYNWDVVKKQDTATCARTLYQENRRGVGVLASPSAAKYYKLEILESNVQNENDSYTRFFILSADSEYVQNADKVSLCFSLIHKAGSLVHLLNKISLIGVNLSKIMSVPLTHDQGHYMFYIDAEYEGEDQYQHLISELESEAEDITIFGKYKKQSVSEGD